MILGLKGLIILIAIAIIRSVITFRARGFMYFVTIAEQARSILVGETTAVKRATHAQANPTKKVTRKLKYAVNETIETVKTSKREVMFENMTCFYE